MSFPETEKVSIKFVSSETNPKSTCIWKTMTILSGIILVVPESWHEITLCFSDINQFEIVISRLNYITEETALL